MLGATRTRAIAIKGNFRNLLQEAAVGVLAKRQHQRVGLQRFELASRLGVAALVDAHHLDREIGTVDRLDRGQPFYFHAFGQGFPGFEVVCRHMRAIPAIDDHRFGGAEAMHRAGDVHGGVASAVYDHAPAQARRGTSFHVAQQRDRVEYLDGVACRDVDMFGEVGTDRDEDRIESARLLLGQDVVDPVVGHELDAHLLDPSDLLRQVRARQAIGRNAEMQHAARQWAGVVDLHLMSEPRQMIGGGKSAWAGADDQHPLAAGDLVDRHRPALRHREVAQETLDGVNADGAVELLAVAAGFAGVIADTSVHSRQRIVADQRFPCGSVVSRLRQSEPRLDVLAGGAGRIAGRKQVHIEGTPMTYRAGASFAREIDDWSNVAGEAVHWAAPRTGTT